VPSHGSGKLSGSHSKSLWTQEGFWKTWDAVYYEPEQFDFTLELLANGCRSRKIDDCARILPPRKIEKMDSIPEP
jgi:hypothetical protein